MTKNLVIVESPNKINKIQTYLNDAFQKNEFKVIASVGHLRDLKKYGTKLGLGIDLELMKPLYENIRAQKATILNIKEEVQKAQNIYLATDPDREGEAIAWHITEIVPHDLIASKKIFRIIFNEITKDAILESINKPGKLNTNLINSQEARRMLDRIIGFRLSHITKKKLSALSAGRVKSSILKLIMDRENEINLFVPVYWWTIEAKLNNKNLLINSDINFKELNYEKEEDVKKVFSSLKENFKYLKEKRTESKISAPEPLEMSSYLMAAFNIYGLSNNQATMASQSLYEKGLITYPRTDSKRISSKKFIEDSKDFLINHYGKDYFNGLRVIKNQGNLQDAHEALRPTELKVMPLSLTTTDYSNLEIKAYDIIWRITAQSFLKDGLNLSIKKLFDNNSNFFITKETLIKFNGFRIVDNFESDKILDSVKNDISLDKKKIEIKKHNTMPPARYNQSSIIKKMKEEGIGRPSTYSSTTSGLVRFGYIEKQKGVLIPTEIGKETNDLLLSQFSDLINEKYTAKMEKSLDEIAEGHLKGQKFLLKFWAEFEPRIKNADETIQMKLPEYVNRLCPNDGGQLIYKRSRYGKFIGCENYPNCKYIEKINENKFTPIDIKKKCPLDNHDLFIKKSKFGTYFISCSNFPKCKYIMEKNEANLIIKDFIKIEKKIPKK